MFACFYKYAYSPSILRWYLLLIAILAVNDSLQAQCMSVPVPLEKRAGKSVIVVSGKVVSKHPFKSVDGHIYTLNKIEVTAYLKGLSTAKELGVLTYGGVLETEAQIMSPALELKEGDFGVFFLESNKTGIVHPGFADLRQYFTYADAQGAIMYQMGYYIDPHAAYKADEKTFFEKIKLLTHQLAVMPSGATYISRQTTVPSNNINARILAVTSFSPTSTRSGTIVPGDFITISGAAFGTTAGAVYFSNADNGGATFTSSGLLSDIISWSDNSITVKVPSNAGTGPINVNGTMTSATALTIDYAHTSVASPFSGFASSTRQRYYLRNINTSGGYTFSLNTSSGFSADAPAIASFTRALQTWSCNTAINWQVGGNTAAGFANDNQNVVLYDATLPVGVLARATSYFSGSTLGACNLTNTVWFLKEIDMQIQAVPLAGYTWEKGTTAPSFSEYDFESVMLHELGHAHGLGHRIAPGQNMNWNISNGTAIRTLNINEVNAGLAKMAYSTSPTCFNPGAGGTPMLPYNTTSCSGVLPVALVRFNATPQNREVNLHWETASEFNNHYFVVERSLDGIHFEEVEVVYGGGNSNLMQEYETTDETPYNGQSYYRLKQVDFDGNYTYSDMVSVKFTDASVAEIQYYPNPTTNTLQFLPSVTNQPYQVSIVAINGMQMYVSENTQMHSLDISSWPAGMYMVELISENGKSISKLIKY